MLPSKCLNNLLFVENLLGVHWNYCSQTKIKKCFIIFQILVQTMFHTILLIVQVYFLLGDGNFFSREINLTYSGYAVSAYIAAMLSVMTGICYSRAFKSYLRSISRISESFKDDKKFINSLKKIYWLNIPIILYIFIVFGILKSVAVLNRFQSLSELVIVSFILVSQSILRITIVFQHLVFFVTIMIVYHLSKCLTSLILAVQEKVGSCGVSSDEQCDITREQIQGWVEMYRDLRNCCDKVTLCFGRQFFSSLLSCLVYYVFMIYQICYIHPFYVSTFILVFCVLTKQTPCDSSLSDKLISVNRSVQHGNAAENKIMIMIVGYVSMLILPLIAGQKASKQGVKLHQVLVRVYNTMTIDLSEADARMIKDFIRLIKKNPIEIRLLSNIPVGMYMLPVVLTLTVNYLVVMLQFMHVF